MYAGGAILALDAATRTGVCCGVPGETPVLETVEFGSAPKRAPKREDCISASEYRRLSALHGGASADFEIWSRAHKWLSIRISDACALKRPVKLMVLEGLVPKYDKTIQCGVYAVFGAIARNWDIPIITAMPQTWRAVVLGEGKLKAAVAKTRAVAVTAQLGWNPQGHDEAEAACLWLWACTKVAPRQTHKFPLFMRGAA